MSSVARSSAGVRPPRSEPILLSTRWKWRFGFAIVRRLRDWCITDRGVQYLSIRYTERLAKEGAVNSVGSRGDSYDNGLAETVVGLYKTELIRRRGPWRTAEQVELATAEWVDWWNRHRLHGAAGNLPPAEFEKLDHDRHTAAVVA